MRTGSLKERIAVKNEVKNTMRTITRTAASLALLFAFAAAAAAQSSKGNGNDSVDYAPKTQNLAGTLPFDRSYTLDITSPSNLNDNVDIAAGITANLRVNVDDFPEASNEAAAAALVTLDDQVMVFNALAQTHQTTVHLHVTSSTIPGDYAFTIQADGPNGIGWGNAGHTLTVTVAEPVPSDTTPPAVVIISPKDGDKFTFCSAGTVVPVTISANDAESLVTSVWATANDVPFSVSFPGASNNVVANGNFTAAGIGAYALQAFARSAGGDGSSEVVNVSVNYTMSWLPPLSIKSRIQRRGRHQILGARLQRRFCCRQPGERRSMGGQRPQIRLRTSEKGVTRSGSMRCTGQYITNFQPGSGVHTYTVKVLFGGFEQASKNSGPSNALSDHQAHATISNVRSRVRFVVMRSETKLRSAHSGVHV